MPAIATGTAAPDFELPDQHGNLVRLSQYRGKNAVVVYFYPKDDTTGCTSEAQAFAAAAGDFKRAGAAVVGVSKDSVKSHDRFKAKYDLNFPLGADADGAVVERYGVWVEKSMYGKTYMGVERSTFVIGPDGKLKAIYRKVKPAEHIAEVLAKL